ncbi:MAG: transcriptional repressor LexA [Chloroflexi bacterium]|nr:transcriptional repressor LexA [Chloroflexota bacterium]
MSEPKSRRRRQPQKLSERQKKILQYIERTYTETGYPPTIREIGKAVDIDSTSVVNYNLNKLEESGYIQREKKVSRGLRLLKTLNSEPFTELGVKLADDTINVVNVPMVGKIVASAPVPVPGDDFGMYYDDDDVIHLPVNLLGSRVKDGEVYALRVNGESMIDALVNHNDIVVLQRQETANNGDMVAVWLDENSETTLKYFYREGAKVRLQPANTMMEPIYVDARQVHIQGRVLAVLRQI